MAEEFKLYMCNIPFDVTEQEITDIFEKYGRITFLRLCTDPETKKSKGFGYVAYDAKQDCESAIFELDGIHVHGRHIQVKPADPKPAQARPQKVSACTHFQKGNCKFGDACKFAHEFPPPKHFKPNYVG
jgi:RNA recognition motif-containing protein